MRPAASCSCCHDSPASTNCILLNRPSSSKFLLRSRTFCHSNKKSDGHTGFYSREREAQITASLFASRAALGRLLTPGLRMGTEMHTPEAVAVVILRGCSRSISYRLSSQFKKEKREKKKGNQQITMMEKVFGINFQTSDPC